VLTRRSPYATLRHAATHRSVPFYTAPRQALPLQRRCPTTSNQYKPSDKRDISIGRRVAGQSLVNQGIHSTARRTMIVWTIEEILVVNQGL